MHYNYNSGSIGFLLLLWNYFNYCNVYKKIIEASWTTNFTLRKIDRKSSKLPPSSKGKKKKLKKKKYDELMRLQKEEELCLSVRIIVLDNIYNFNNNMSIFCTMTAWTGTQSTIKKFTSTCFSQLWHLYLQLHSVVVRVKVLLGLQLHYCCHRQQIHFFFSNTFESREQHHQL